MQELIRIAEESFAPEEPKQHPNFRSGDTVTVSYRITEGNKVRNQDFRGVVLQIKGQGQNKTFTVRKMSSGIGVERIFPLNSPFIEKIEINKHGRVRRSRIYYFRKLTGKKANIRERIVQRTSDKDN